MVGLKRRLQTLGIPAILWSVSLPAHAAEPESDAEAPAEETPKAEEGDAPADESKDEPEPAKESSDEPADAPKDEAGDASTSGEASEEVQTVELEPSAAKPPTTATTTSTDRSDGPTRTPPPGGPQQPPGVRTISSRAGQDVEDPNAWKFGFHGYFNAPMRVGMGEREIPEGEDSLPAGQNEVTFHAPIVPDDQFLSWQHTVHNPRSWAELYFSYGNPVVTGTVAIEAFNYTDAAWNQQNAQLGIGQGFVTITPKFRRTPVKFKAKIGAFDGRYGMAGRYDLGQYETYLHGRTRAMGEIMQLEIPIRSFAIILEHGIGAARPDPNIWNTSRFTLLQHAHLGARYKEMVHLYGHFMIAGAREEERNVPAAEPGIQDVTARDGRMMVAGPELRFNGGRFGYAWAGYSWIKADAARVVGPAIEVIHAQGGGNYSLGIVDNYLEERWTDADGDGILDNDSGGNGTIHSLMFQIDHSLMKIIKGDEFWGEGMDLALSLYMMFNKIQTDDADLDGIHKFKYGADAIFSALPWLGVGMRYDRLQPNSDIPEQSFSILSPRLIFRSKWVTHEMITVQYSRYFYNQRTCGDPMMADQRLCVQSPSAANVPDGFGATAEDQNDEARGQPVAPPDENTFLLQASMWW